MNSTANGNDYILSDTSVASSYLIDDTNLYATNVIYTTAAGEKMRLGFTAVYDGEYQISAPISTELAKGVHYRVVKETKEEVKSILQEDAIYNGEEYFTLINTVLAAGDTVYLEAWSDYAGIPIKLGVPQAVYLGENAKENSVRYSANEYMAIDHTNDLGYKSIWRAGTFVNPFIIGDKEYKYLYDDAYLAAINEGVAIDYDVLGLGEYSSTDNPDTYLDETDGSELYDLFYEYDSIAVYTEGSSNDYFYQTKDSRIRNYANTDSGYSYGGDPLRYFNSVGILSVSKVPTNTTVSIMYGCGVAPGGGARNVYMNFGHYRQFIAPENGTALLDLGGYENSGKVIVLHNTKVIATYTGGILPDSDNSIEIKLNEGDTVSIAYAKIDDEMAGIIATSSSTDIASVVTFTPEIKDESTISFDSATSVIMKAQQSNGTVITLPTTSKAGALFCGWKAENKLYGAGDKYTINSDVEFEAVYIYYGDLNGTGEGVKADDISIMRKILLGYSNIDTAVNADIAGDIDTNGKIDLVDLIRIKKMSAGVDVSVGIQ